MHEEIKDKGLWGGRLIIFESLPSTNKWVLDPANDCRHGDIIYARAQTCGRGRFHRDWHTPGNTCLTISIVIRHETPDALPYPLLTQYAAMAVRSTLSMHGITAMLKWPNDVFVHSRKIAGILAECSTNTSRIALGIGLNINMTTTDFSGMQLRQPGTSMTMETGLHHDVDTVCSALASEIKTNLTDLKNSEGRSLRQKWKDYDYLANKEIRIETSNNSTQGLYSGMDAKGRLTLVDDTDNVHSFWSGDVSTEDLS